MYCELSMDSAFRKELEMHWEKRMRDRDTCLFGGSMLGWCCD